MASLTNEQTETAKFAAFITEGMRYVDAWCATQVNEGGCGFFAKILSDKFKELNIKHEVVCIWFLENPTDKHEKEGEKREFDSVKDYLKNGTVSSNHLGAHHVLIRVGELYIDSTGIANWDFLMAEDSIVITDENLEKLDNICRWNPIFDKNCVPKMKNLMDEVFRIWEVFKSGCFKYPGYEEVKFTDYTIKEMERKDREDRIERVMAGEFPNI